MQDDASATAARPARDQIGASVADMLGARGDGPADQCTRSCGFRFKDEGESRVMLYILIGYMFLFIHRPFEIWPALGEMHVERVYILAAAAVWLFCSGKRLQPSRLDMGIIGFCSAVLFAWMLSPWSDLGQPVVEDWLKIVVFYGLVSTAITKPDELRKLLIAFLAIMTLYMMHSLWEFQNGRHTFRMGIARMIGVDRTAIRTASAPASFFALPFVRMFCYRRRNESLLRCRRVMLGCPRCILLTGSRSSPGFSGLGLHRVHDEQAARLLGTGRGVGVRSRRCRNAPQTL